MNKTNIAAFGLAAALILLSFGAVRAGSSNNYAIDWQVMSGGGAPASSSGGVTLNGSLGQTAVGPATGGNVSLGAGYWIGVKPTPYPHPDEYIYLPVVCKR